MDDIITLLSRESSPDERVAIANIIITQYDLPFNVDEMITMTKHCLNHYAISNAARFIHLLLTTNLRLFIAITYAMLDNKMTCRYWLLTLLTHDETSARLGCSKIFNRNDVQQVYCALYDYYEFDITDLVLPESVRDLIQKHIDGKVSYVKRAIKK